MRQARRMKNLLILILAAALAAPSLAAPPQQTEGARADEVRIPFPRFRLRDFRADSRDVVFLEDRNRNWYRAEVTGPCLDLPFAPTIGIDTRGSSSFDRFSTLVVGGERCQLVSLTRSEKPQKRTKKPRA
jgi:hypothetical protein